MSAPLDPQGSARGVSFAPDSSPAQPPAVAMAPPLGLVGPVRGSVAAEEEDEGLPIIRPDLCEHYDPRTHSVRGTLFKKGGTRAGGLLNRRNWNKRLFVIECDIPADHNFTIKYFKDASGAPKGELNLEGTHVTMEDKAHSKDDIGYEFQIEGARSNTFEMYAETEAERAGWIKTLQYVITMANKRGAFQSQAGVQVKRKENFQSARSLSGGVGELDAPPAAAPQLAAAAQQSSGLSRSNKKKKNASRGMERAIREPVAELPASPFEATVPTNSDASGQATSGTVESLHHDNLALRLDADLDAMPAGSAERTTFVQHFQDDVARVCALLPDEVTVLTLRHAPTLDWMTIVEFRFECDPAFPQMANEMRRVLGEALRDEESVLFHGHVTCNTDPTFTAGIVPTQGKAMNQLAFSRSPDPTVQRVLAKYSTVKVPTGVLDLSSFCITLVWDTLERDLWVLNPRLFDRKACLVWQQDVMRALGLTGSVHEQWMSPTELQPLGLPRCLTANISFLPSVRSSGLPTIDAGLLKAGLRYKVKFNDTRREAVKQLTDQQQAEIQERFAHFDVNQDNTISNTEAVAYAQQRTQDALQAMEAQYQAFLVENQDPDDQAQAFENRDKHVVNIREAEEKLLDMFKKADVNGDGQLSFEEFILAEAWWLKSTMNPSKVALF